MKNHRLGHRKARHPKPVAKQKKAMAKSLILPKNIAPSVWKPKPIQCGARLVVAAPALELSASKAV
ncbi:hypothetical protein, partial [Herpetosiphon sp.]|uniref:hypothetical protein n=1 Tax=Herpetosiphon sp. TaxID=71864 RepID=UPI00257A4CAA